MQKTRIFGIGAILGVLALLSGCGLNMQQYYQKMQSQLHNHDYDGADKYIDSVKESFYSKDNRLLYYMDKGMVLHLAKRYKESNEFLEKAKTAAEELWTESISANAAALVTTDNALPYQGEDFEKVLIHFVAALNYIGLHEYESARVEARQISEKLELYNSKYTEEDGKNVYKDDAFSRWLSGKLSETEGGSTALNDAWIDYAKALSIYSEDYKARYATPVPRMVVEDALRVLTALGSDFSEELGQVKTKFPGVQMPAVDKAMGEVVFIHMAGESPYKVDKYWDAMAENDPLRIGVNFSLKSSVAVKWLAGHGMGLAYTPKDKPEEVVVAVAPSRPAAEAGGASAGTTSAPTSGNGGMVASSTTSPAGTGTGQTSSGSSSGSAGTGSTATSGNSGTGSTPPPPTVSEPPPATIVVAEPPPKQEEVAKVQKEGATIGTQKGNEKVVEGKPLDPKKAKPTYVTPQKPFSLDDLRRQQIKEMEDMMDEMRGKIQQRKSQGKGMGLW